MDKQYAALPDPTWEGTLDLIGSVLLCPCKLNFMCVCVCVCTPVNPNLGGIVQSVTPSMPVEFHVCACTAFHFQITLFRYNNCLSHGQCGVYIPGVHTVGG